MERLKGKTILIGKEPGQGRLLVSIAGKTAALGSPNSVPNSVSRCKPAEGVAHAKITVDQSGNMILSNLKSQNVTYVNGSEIVSKRITPNNSVELGKDRFSVSVPMILEASKKIIAATSPVGFQSHVGSQSNSKPEPPKQEVKKYNISHLERVWNEFHDKGMELKQRQRRQGLMSRLPMFFTVGGGAISTISVALGWPESVKTLCISLTVLGLIIMIYSFVKSKNDTSIEDSEKIQEEFELRYVCPNPDCNKFLGVISYKLLKNQLRSHKDQKMYCPRCGCELVEK